MRLTLRNRRVREWGVVAAACVGLVALALYDSAHKVVGCDEARTLRTVLQTTFAGTFDFALWFERQGPVYFTLVHGWMVLGRPTIEWARLPSTLAAVAAVIGVAATLRQLIPRNRASWLAVVVAACPAVLWAASESRVYALAMCWTAWSFYFYARIWLVNDARATRRVWIDAAPYVVTTYLALMTLYYTGFVVLGQFVAAVCFARRRWLLVAADATIALLLLPWLPVIRRQVMVQGADTATSTAVPASVGAHVAATFGAALRDTHIIWNAGLFDRPVVRAVIVLGLAALVLVRLRPGSPPLSKAERMTPVIAIVPLLVLGFLEATHLGLVRDRHRTVVIVPALICIAVWVGSLPRRRAAVIASGALVTLFAAMLVSYQRNLDRGLGWPRAATWVTAAAHPGEPILFTDTQCATAFAYYYRGPNVVLGVPQNDAWGPLFPTVPFRRQGMISGQREITGLNAVEYRLAPALAGTSSFWLVVQDATFNIVGGPFLDAYLHAHADSIWARSVDGVTVSHWTTRPEGRQQARRE